jgi:hypothetical protein
MPNWCNNNLILEHDDPAMIQRAHEALERGELLQEFIPVPQELKETISGAYGDPVEQAKLEAQTRANVAKYGCSDVHPGGTMLHASFDSAWSPPVNAYQKLEALGFRVEAMFYEGGMAFAGSYEDGNCEDFSLEGMTADDIEQNYPELDDCFGISESIREYERENEEELTAWIKDGKEKLAQQ